MSLGADPVVSVEVVTYNHEAFIGGTLDGILSQKTDFAYEIVLHDDASTDGTAAIVREYQQRHPDILFPILQTENQWSKGVNVSTQFNSPRLRGRYVATCEGDDLWVDPDKLAKQVAILDANPEVALVHTAFCTNVPPTDEYLQYQRALAHRPRAGDLFASLLCDNTISTPTVMLRTHLARAVDATLERVGFKNPIDKWYWLELAMLGKFAYLPDVTAMYRIHDGGMSRNTTFMLERDLAIFNDQFRRNLKPRHLEGISAELLEELASQALQQLYARQIPWQDRMAMIPCLKKLPTSALWRAFLRKLHIGGPIHP